MQAEYKSSAKIIDLNANSFMGRNKVNDFETKIGSIQLLPNKNQRKSKKLEPLLNQFLNKAETKSISSNQSRKIEINLQLLNGN